MKAIFYNFSKKLNSTKQPTGGTELDVVLKQPTSIHNPIFRVRTISFDYNYMYVPDFQTYYWINENISVTNEVWEFGARVDVLATYKASIGSTTTYISYAAEDYDEYKIDSRCALVPTIHYNAANDVYLPNMNTTGSYVLTVVNDKGGACGFCTSYFINRANFKKLVEELIGYENVWEEFLQLLQSPLDFIVSCIWLPIGLGQGAQWSFEIDGSTEPIVIGKWQSSATAFKIGNSSTEHGETDITIPWRFNDFRRNAPYTVGSLYLPYHGLVEVDLAPFIRSTTIKCKYSYDVCTGDVSVQLWTTGDTGVPVATYNYNWGVNIPVASLTSNYGSMIAQLGSAAGSLGMLAAGNVVAGSVGLASSVGSLMAASLTPKGGFKGNIQGKTLKDFATAIKLILISYDTEDPDNYALVKGRPIMDYKQISAFSGYVQCENASVSAHAPIEELSAINNFLNSGIFYE